MSAQDTNKLLAFLGVITAGITIFIQISAAGEIKGRFEATIGTHERRLTNLEVEVRDHDRQIRTISVGSTQTTKQ